MIPLWNCFFFVPLFLVMVDKIKRKERVSIDMRDILIVSIVFYSDLTRKIGMGITLSSIFATLVYVVCVFSAYFVAKDYVLGAHGGGKKEAESLFIVFSLGLFLQGFVNHIYRLIFWKESVKSELFCTLWTDYDLPRTQHAIFFLFSSSLIFYGAYMLYNRYKKGAFFFSIALSGLLLEYITEGRILLFSFIITLGGIVLLFVFRSMKNKKSRKKFIAFLSGFIICFTSIFIIGGQYLFNIYRNSYLSGSGGIIHNVRFNYMITTIKMVPRYPLGFNEETLYCGSRHSVYAHNLLLDVIKQYGVFSFLLLCTLMVLVVKDALKMYMSNKIDIEEKLILLVSFIFVNIYFFIEVGQVAFVQGVVLFGIIRGRVMQVEERENI